MTCADVAGAKPGLGQKENLRTPKKNQGFWALGLSSLSEEGRRGLPHPGRARQRRATRIRRPRGRAAGGARLRKGGPGMCRAWATRPATRRAVRAGAFHGHCLWGVSRTQGGGGGGWVLSGGGLATGGGPPGQNDSFRRTPQKERGGRGAREGALWPDVDPSALLVLVLRCQVELASTSPSCMSCTSVAQAHRLSPPLADVETHRGPPVAILVAQARKGGGT